MTSLKNQKLFTNIVDDGQPSRQQFLYTKSTGSTHIKQEQELIIELPTDDERPFHCPICAKAFRGRNILREHMASHSDERPFECKLCKKMYKTRNALRKHKRTHVETDKVGFLKMSLKFLLCDNEIEGKYKSLLMIHFYPIFKNY